MTDLEKQKLELERESRMSRLETLVGTIAESVEKIDKKIDKNHEQTQLLISNLDGTTRKSLEYKADKSEVENIREKTEKVDGKLYNLVVSGLFQALAVITALITAIIALNK